MRAARVERGTRETSVTVELDLDGKGASSVETGIPFLDHMLDQLARHARFDVSLKAEGDLQVDAHHTVEDVGALGQALSEALGDRAGIRRFGHATVPLDYGMGNLRSVTRGVQRAGGRARLVTEPEGLADATGLVVPGVGAFGACMANLAALGLDGGIVEFARLGRPVLGVCLGTQVLFEWSEEGEVDGLRLLGGKVRRLPPGPGVKVPHMGWNDVTWTRAHPSMVGVASGPRFYFVPGYACEAAAEITVSETEHGVRFAAVVPQGNLFAMQFHPEKSGPAGHSIYQAFVDAASLGREDGAR